MFMITFRKYIKRSMNSNSTQESEQFYSAKSQISQQSMSVIDDKDNDTTFVEALETTGDRDNDTSDTTILETVKTVVEMEKTGQPQTVQVSQQDPDPKEKVIKMFSDQTEANMLNYILNTK